MNSKPGTVADIEGFVTMLQAAREDDYMQQTLKRILSLPDNNRREVVIRLVQDLRARNAPDMLVEAIGCLVDDEVASKARELISQQDPG